MNIEEIKVGETYFVRVKITGKSDKWVDFVTANPSGEENLPVLGRSGFHYSELDDAISPIPPTPKHDPCRLFKKGDKVRVVEWNGRHFHDRDYGVDIKTGCVAKIDESEKDDPKKCAVKVAYRQYLFTVPTCFLQLVTPVEELKPYYVEEQDSCYVVGKRQESPEMEYIAGFSKTRHPNAKAAAEAECDRLNAEWRKEQNNG